MDKKILGVLVLGIIAILGVGFVAAYGFGGGFMNMNFTDEEKTEMQEQRQAMQNAIENKDYATWKSLMKDRIAKMQEFIEDENNFNNLVERHEKMAEFREAMQEARESGDFSKVKELKEDFGFEGKMFRRGRFGGCPKLAE